MERKLAVITGADGGMGTEITRAVACAGLWPAIHRQKLKPNAGSW